MFAATIAELRAIVGSVVAVEVAAEDGFAGGPIAILAALLDAGESAVHPHSAGHGEGHGAVPVPQSGA